MLSLNQSLMLATLILLYREMQRPKVRNVGAAVCQSKYCTQIHVDNPQNTELKDQSLSMGLGAPTNQPGMATVYAKVQSDYVREQVNSPGVQLVAHHVLKET